jgi:hypothetical protein
MTEEQKVDVQHEGENPFKSEEENDNSASSPDETNETEDTQSPEGDENTQDEEKEKPFNEHPRWQEREKEWDKRFNDQEARHQEDLKAMREEFGAARKENAEQTTIPSWFGGDQAQWDAYRKDRDAEIKAAENRAYERITSEKLANDKAVQEATEFMRSEMAEIESDKTLNPSGAKIDPNKLLKIVMDNDLVDSKGRWNYRAGARLLQQTQQQNGSNRKAIAGATTSESKGETKPAPFKTSADFKKTQPW